MRVHFAVVAVLVLAVACATFGESMSLEKVPVTRGYYTPGKGEVVVNGRFHADWANAGKTNYGSYGVFDIRGWDHFTTGLGIRDDGYNTPAEVIIRVDGEEVWKQVIKYGQDPIRIDIGLTGHQSLSIQVDKPYCVLLQPTLSTGNPTPYVDPPRTPVVLTVTSPTPPYSLDYTGLDRLARKLAELAAAKAGVDPIVREQGIALVVRTPNLSWRVMAVGISENLAVTLADRRMRVVAPTLTEGKLRAMGKTGDGDLQPADLQPFCEDLRCGGVLFCTLVEQEKTVTVLAHVVDHRGETLVAAREDLLKIPVAPKS